MQIVLNIAENSNVEIVSGGYELVQGECCARELKFNFPATIKDIPINDYAKRIEFGECKDFGECAKFTDKIENDIYELREECTAFKKIMVQVICTYGKITWKTVPFALEFHESINAEGNTVIQAQILHLADIEQKWADDLAATKAAWERFIKSNALRMVHSVGEVPTADASSLGDTIFYLGANTDTAPYLTYGHYYKCNYVSGVYEWTDLTQAPNLAGVADGVREINKNRTLQFWQGTMAELENEVPQENVAYIAEDCEIKDILEEYVPDIKVNEAVDAKTAEHAHTADYADADESKGKIDDRLKRLWAMVTSVVDTSFTKSITFNIETTGQQAQVEETLFILLDNHVPYGVADDWKIVSVATNTNGAVLSTIGNGGANVMFYTSTGNKYSNITATLTIEYRFTA